MRFLLLLALALPVWAIELATGRMLGPGHDPRAFYMRHGSGPWARTYTGPEYRPEAAGRLMNLRVAQAVVHDEWLREEPFDPEKNTDRVIAALDTYQHHGILAISVSLQGANAAYELTPNIKRIRAYKLGPGKGMHMSAFRPDGSLKPEWMARTLRLARELDRRGMVLHLLYYYQHQDEILRYPAALRQGAVNVTDWLIDNNLRNVLIEVANEIDANTYDHDGYLAKNLGEMIELIRGRFEAKKAGYRLPISTSTTGGAMMQVPPAIFEHADLVLLHGNNRTPQQKGRRTAELLADPGTPGPVVFSEDNNGRDTDEATLKLEIASLDAIWKAGGSWGYMPWKPAQIFPFRFYDPVKHDHPDARYFAAMLEHIRRLVYVDRHANLRLAIDENFTRGVTKGTRPQDPGEFTPDGWKVNSERCQIRYDLGRFYVRGAVELQIRGPLFARGANVKRNAFAAWNEEAASDGDRKTQSFFQLRFQEGGMMLRLSNRSGGKSYEGKTGVLDWDDARWYTIRGEWDTASGINRLYRDGILIQSGKFNAGFPGFRWLFIGKDNYQSFVSIPGVTYRNLRVWVEE